jgi:hypothetical protein
MKFFLFIPKFIFRNHLIKSKLIKTLKKEIIKL